MGPEPPEERVVEELQNDLNDGDDESGSQGSDASSTASPPRRVSKRTRFPKMRTNMRTFGGTLELEPVNYK